MTMIRHSFEMAWEVKVYRCACRTEYGRSMSGDRAVPLTGAEMKSIGLSADGYFHCACGERRFRWRQRKEAR